MGDAPPVERLHLLCFRWGLGGDTPLEVVEFANVLLVPMCCHFQGSLAT